MPGPTMDRGRTESREPRSLWKKLPASGLRELGAIMREVVDENGVGLPDVTVSTDDRGDSGLSPTDLRPAGRTKSESDCKSRALANQVLQSWENVKIP